MLCRLSRWMVSRSQDTGKKLPRAIERHVGRCLSCGAFARSSMALASELRAERAAWLAKVPDFAVGLEPGPALALEARAPRRLLFGLRPLPVAAAALAVVASGVILFQAVRRQGPSPTPQDLVAARSAIMSLSTAPRGFGGVVGEAESSLERERRILEKSIASAAEYVQARLNIKIERRTPPTKPS